MIWAQVRNAMRCDLFTKFQDKQTMPYALSPIAQKLNWSALWQKSGIPTCDDQVSLIVQEIWSYYFSLTFTSDLLESSRNAFTSRVTLKFRYIHCCFTTVLYIHCCFTICTCIVSLFPCVILRKCCEMFAILFPDVLDIRQYGFRFLDIPEQVMDLSSTTELRWTWGWFSELQKPEVR